jgi:hypothetical protein
VENFAGYSSGIYKNVNWSGVGTIDEVSLIKNNLYGGTPSSKIYPVDSTSGGLGGIKQTTISLNSGASYFGLYWSAGDQYNRLSFYNGNNLVSTFTTGTLMSLLPKSYYGNPNPANKGQDSGEAFGFINFFAQSGTIFNKIVLDNAGSSGFESQDWTVRNTAYNPLTDGKIPGVPVAEVTTTGGVSTTTKITSVSFDGKSVVATTTGGKAVTFETVATPAGKGWSSYAYNVAGHAPGVANPEPSAYLTFGLLGTIVLVVARRRKTPACELMAA